MSLMLTPLHHIDLRCIRVYLLLFDAAGNEIFFGIMFILIFYTHRENIKRLINKEENKTKIY